MKASVIVETVSQVSDVDHEPLVNSTNSSTYNICG